MQNTVGFVSKVLVPGTNASTAKRKVRRALGSVSTLLCIHDDCLHSIHKSFKDWLTETSCYGEHEFIMDEIERQLILADLCTEELNDLKWKGVNNVQLRPANAAFRLERFTEVREFTYPGKHFPCVNAN